MKTLMLLCCSAAGALLDAQTSANWTRQIPQTFPSLRAGDAMAYDSAHGQTVLFGGTSLSGSDLNDTWLWDGSNWTQVFPQSSPPARHDHAMAYDSARGQVVMFGGTVAQNNPVELNDTWLWDGVNWTEAFPQSSPPAQVGLAMAFDSGHGQVVILAAFFEPNPHDETWTWDGSNWTQQLPQTAPPFRGGHALAYDSKHGQVVLFGGNDGGRAEFNETWTWDGSNWTQQFPTTSPSGRDGLAMAYDSAHAETVVFGGETITYLQNGFYSTFLNDTWVWDGSNWTQSLTQTSPPVRWVPEMAYDSARGQVVMFGGYGNGYTVYLQDTWTWDGGPSPPVLPSIGNVVSATAFGGFSDVSPGSFVEIYGSNLAPDTRGWTKADFTGNQAPTVLDGVEVSIAGQNAFVNYIVESPGQVNVQMPSNIPTGTQQITVTNKSGSSAPFNITVNATEPGLLAPSSFNIGGKQYVVAFLADNVTYVLPEGAIAGILSRPAKPGETIVMYGIGFGPVAPGIPAGELVEEDNQLVARLEILFGGVAGELAYSGLSPGLVGVYQFDVVVPAIPDNDSVPLSFTLGGLAGIQTLYTAVKQ
jgi:uncharacterized protein (TIGR03437 family)